MIKNIEVLRTYSELEGSELGEYCFRLIELSYFNTDHGMGFDFERQLQEEVNNQLNIFRTQCRIIEEEVTETFNRKSLEWLDD